MRADWEREFDDFAKSQRARLSGLARLVAPSPGHAEDVLQTAMLQIWKAWGSVRAAADPDAYARRVLINVAVSLSRRPWFRERPFADITAAQDGSTDRAARSSTDQINDRDQLLRALARLPTRQRIAVVLRYFADLDDAAVAQAMNTSVQTVRSQISRALATLRIQNDSPDTHSHPRALAMPGQSADA